MVRWLCVALALMPTVCGQETSFQPTAVVTVEKSPARKVYGSISLPFGSVFCNGRPTYWLVGHSIDEAPYCLNVTDDGVDFEDYDYSGSSWVQDSPAIMDRNDAKNVVDGPRNIDRHDCTLVDANLDGTPDIVCGVGANKGEGFGFNELYLTVPMPNNTTGNATLTPPGSLVKIPDAMGIQKFPTMRNRFMRTLRGADDSQLVFLATQGSRREDREPNQHRMFRLVETVPESSSYFEEVRPAPWQRYSRARCVLVVDVNVDGLDDIVMCNEDMRAFLFLQNPDGSWTNANIKGTYSRDWRNARVADVNGDGIPDLVTVSADKGPSLVRVFAGLGQDPFFDFRRRAQAYYELELPFASPDLEVLDINGDGRLDIYIVQTDERTKNSYCAGRFVNREWWAQGTQPPPEFVPPLDVAPDVLLVGSQDRAKEKFRAVTMHHSEPGCGFFVEKFGNNKTMVLSQGSNNRPGHNLLLQW